MNYIKKNIKFIGLICCGLVIIGCFLPLYSNTLASLTFNYADRHGIIVMIATAISALLIILNKKQGVLISNIIASLVFI